jgi:hypothetical protein
VCQHLLVYLVRLVSFNLHRPTRSTPLTFTAPCTASKSIKRVSCGGGAVTGFGAAVAGGGGVADDRTHNVARPYSSAPPARRVAPGTAQPLRRR